MKKTFVTLSVIATAVLVFGTVCTAQEQDERGGALFMQHCSPCHPGGGNIINSQKTLHKKDRDASGVKNASDIVGKMRNPGPGMSTFDSKTVPDKDAKKIAEYILKTFQ